VKRAALGSTAALAATALIAAAGSGGPAGPSSASADACVPVQHSKKVVKRKKVRRKGGLVRVRGKKVWRKGKLVRVKRKKIVRWTTCEPPPATPCPEPSSTLGVTARDSGGLPRYTLSRPCVTAGGVSVELNNQGEDPHHVFLRPLGTSEGDPAVKRLPDTAPFEVPPGMQASATFSLAPGTWYLWCDLLLHEQQGMSATLEVR
jgi:hypothetical protein